MPRAIKFTPMLLYYFLLIVEGVTPSSLSNLVAASTSNSITLIWTQPILPEEVERYIIMYNYTIRECSANSQRITVLVNDSSAGNHTIVNSPRTPVEEYSIYYISLIAIHNTTKETKLASTTINTPQTAPSGVPELLQITDVNLFNVSLKWERVVCLLRNGRIYGYRASYYPITNSDDSRGRVLVGTGKSSRRLTITGLQPRTSYTFVVMAINIAILAFGPATTITFHTSVPEYVAFAINGQLYRNNSIVTISNIGEDTYSALLCVTNSLDCCETIQANSTTGDWYLPSGSPLDISDKGAFSQHKGLSALYLFKRGTTVSPLDGIFRCDIPDVNHTIQSIYVGLYNPDVGSPTIVSLTLNEQDSCLVCISTGGPATTVVWKRDGSAVHDGDGDYRQIQTISDTKTATYENKLFSRNLVGNFTCAVINSRGRAESFLALNDSGSPVVVDVTSFCSVVVWNKSQVSCEEITGYEVRLHDPDTGQEVTHCVSHLTTHYIITDRDKSQLRLDNVYVQVRALNSLAGPAEWSDSVPLGCKKSPEFTGVHFIHQGRFYSNNSKIALCIIGEGDNALLCKTDFVNCCHTPPNRLGMFYYPNGIQVSIKNRGHSFYRDRREQEVRLHKRQGAVSPIGKFRCEVPDRTGELKSIYIELV